MPAQAGGLATLFLAGVVLSSVILSPFFHRMNGRWLAPLGFLTSACALYAMTRVDGFAAFAMLHLVAGFATGIAISFTHGTMGRTDNPHRVFAFGSFGLGLVAVLFLGVTPGLIAKNGPDTVFFALSGVMGVAGVVGLWCFPSVAGEAAHKLKGEGFTRRVWFVIFGIMGMALVQAMIFSFVERIGADNGLSVEQMQGILALVGVMSILPSILAAFLEKRFSAIKVAMVGATLQAVFAVIITSSSGLLMFALPTILFPFVMVFTHTFVFGHLARIEPTGRAVAATPAMIMTGSAVAPLLGGVLVQFSGYLALGLAAVLVGCTALILFARSYQAGKLAVPAE